MFNVTQFVAGSVSLQGNAVFFLLISRWFSYAHSILQWLLVSSDGRVLKGCGNGHLSSSYASGVVDCSLYSVCSLCVVEGCRVAWDHQNPRSRIQWWEAAVSGGLLMWWVDGCGNSGGVCVAWAWECGGCSVGVTWECGGHSMGVAQECGGCVVEEIKEQRNHLTILYTCIYHLAIISCHISFLFQSLTLQYTTYLVWDQVIVHGCCQAI